MSLWWAHACIALACLTIPVVAVTDASVVAGQNTTDGLVVRISLAKRTFSKNESIKVSVRISNHGDEPIAIGNFISTNVGDPVSHIEFQLRDLKGHIFPYSAVNEGMVPPDRETIRAIAVMKSWMLLSPGHSVSRVLSLDPGEFKNLKAPGTYVLSAIYFSPGLSSPGAYHGLGLGEEELKDLPFACWSGRISTNTITFQIVSTVPN